MIHESLDIDGRMFLTLKTLLLKPGLLSLEYRNGRRASYTPPFRMYLVVSIFFFVLISYLDFSGSGHIDNPTVRSEYYPKIMFILLPVFALLLQLFFRGTFYLSNLIFAIHIHCIAYLVFAITLPLEVYEQNYPLFVYLQIPFIAYLLAYIVLALKRYYAQSWTKIVAKSAALFILYSSVLGLSFDYVLHATLSG